MLNPVVTCRGLDCSFGHLLDAFFGLFNFALGLAAFVGLLFILWGGVQMLIGWLEEEPEGRFKAGMLTVRRAIFGLFLVAATYLIVQTLVVTILGVEADSLNEFVKGLLPGAS